MYDNPVGTLKFKSPILLEGSWGARCLAKKAASIMKLYFNRDGSGYIAWEVPSLHIYEEITLTFEYDAKGVRTLTDYGGVMSLPNEAMDLMEAHGVNCAEMRETLAD